MSTEAVAETQIVANAGGKYLTFKLNEESYGIAVLRIREIIRLQPITTVPQMPAYIKGVLNLRGKIIPVIDLRLKFCLAQPKDTERTCIIVVQVQSAQRHAIPMGLIVDSVEEVLNITPADIEPTPDFGTALDTQYLLGMAKVKGEVKTLLDIDRVLASEPIPFTG